jgi:hypothetical protein
MDGIAHRLRTAPEVFGYPRRMFSSGAGKKDLGSAQHERIGGAQALLEGLVLLFGKRTDENRRPHDHYCSALHTTYLGCALDKLEPILAGWVHEGAGPVRVQPADFFPNVLVNGGVTTASVTLRSAAFISPPTGESCRGCLRRTQGAKTRSVMNRRREELSHRKVMRTEDCDLLV